MHRMSVEPIADLTTILQRWREGSGTAFSDLLNQVYDELKVIASRRLGQSGSSATLSPTELLHEALMGFMPASMDFKNRAHFFATMSLAIRSVLVDHARARAAQKRGGDAVRVNITDLDVGEESAAIDLLAMNEALTKLEALDSRAGQVMHLTYFGGLEQEDIAAILEISVPTVKRDLRFARAWLTRAMAGEI